MIHSQSPAPIAPFPRSMFDVGPAPFRYGSIGAGHLEVLLRTYRTIIKQPHTTPAESYKKNIHILNQGIFLDGKVANLVQRT